MVWCRFEWNGNKMSELFWFLSVYYNYVTLLNLATKHTNQNIKQINLYKPVLSSKFGPILSFPIQYLLFPKHSNLQHFYYL